MWDHGRGDLHPGKHAARGMAGRLPGDAREKGPSCGTDEAS